MRLQPARGDEVERAQADAGDEQEDEVAHAAPSRRIETPSSSRVELDVGHEVGRRAAVHDLACVEDDDAVGDPPHQWEVLLDQEDRGRPRHLRQHVGDLGDELGREALRRFVDEQERVLAQQDPRQRHHLLLTTGQRARALPTTRDEVGEEPPDHRGVDTLVGGSRA